MVVLFFKEDWGIVISSPIGNTGISYTRAQKTNLIFSRGGPFWKYRRHKLVNKRY